MKKEHPSLHHPIDTLITACLITCFAVASVYLTQSIFPVIADSFAMPSSAGRLTFTYASISYAIAFFVIGPFSDCVSPRALAGWGLLVTAAALAAGAMCQEFVGLLLAVSCMGAAAASVPAAMFALVPRLARPKQLGAYFGMIIAASVIGISVGRSLPGLFTEQIGWRATFFAYAAILLLAAGVAQRLPSRPFVSMELQQPVALKPLYVNSLSLLIAPRLMPLFLTGFFLFFAYLGCITFLTYRLHQAPFLLNSGQIGEVGFLGLVAIIGAPLSGLLTTRFGSHAVALLGLFVVTFGMLILGQATTLAMVTVGILALFFGVFFCQPAIFTMIASQVEPGRRGSASAMYLLICFSAGSAASWGLEPLWASQGFNGVIKAAIGTIGLAAALLTLDLWRSRVLITSQTRKEMIVKSMQFEE